MELKTIPVGDYLRASLSVCNVENEIFPLHKLGNGFKSLIILFVPYCFEEDTKKGNMAALIAELSSEIEIFRKRSLRLIAITR
jgi:hypothetical protein